MFVNAIRFKTQSDSDFNVLRFIPGTGKYTNVICYYDDEQLYKICLKLFETFFVSTKGNFVESAAQFTDNEGNLWIIEKNLNSTLLLFNSQPITEEDPQKCLLEALLDIKLNKSVLKDINNIKIFDFVTVELDANQNLLYKRYDFGSQLKSKLFAISNTQINYLLERIYNVCSQLRNHSITTVVDYKNKLYPIYLKFLELKSQKESLIGGIKNFDDVDIRQLNQLNSELELINELEGFAKPLLDPKTSLDNLEKELIKYETLIKKELEACGLNHLFIIGTNINWEGLLDTRSQLELYKKLCSASEKLLTFKKNNIDVLYTEYINILEEYFKHDTRVTQELEACLNTLSQHVDSINRSIKKSLLHSLYQFFSLQGSVANNAEKIKAENQALLDGSKMTIDFILGKIGELLSNVNKANTTYQEHQNKFYQMHQALIKETEVLEQKWSVLAKENGIDINYSLNNLIKLFGKYASILDLWNKKQKLKAEIHNQQVNLQHVERIFLQWCKITNSQKEVFLSSDRHLLLSEVQGILRYKQSKEQLLNSLKENSAKACSYLALKNYLEFRLQKLYKKWQDGLESLGITHIPITDDNLQNLFNLILKLENWLEFQNEQNSSQFSSILYDSEIPIKLIYVKKNLLSDKNRIDFLKEIETLSDNCFYVLFIEDKKLYDILLSLGVGGLKFSKSNINIRSKTLNKTFNINTQSVINPKAKEAINILTSYKRLSQQQALEVNN